MDRLFAGITPKKQEWVVRMAALSLAAIVAFLLRLFAVIRYESVIHEYDPYFNYRTTQYLTENGYYNFHNWFDEKAWYPLGRIIGGTIYPGLMVTSLAIFRVMHALHLTIHIREVCVFLAPFFSSLTTIVTYLLAKELSTTGAGLFAAAFVAIVPGYISRSVAGSYDNEGIAIFLMLLTYYLWIRAIKTGSVYEAAKCAFAYFYMVTSWGGYVFLINLIPLHIFALIVVGRFNDKHYVAYNTVYTIGTILSMQVPFVGFQPILTSEHMAALGVFGLCQLVAFSNYIKKSVSTNEYRVLMRAIIFLFGAVCYLAIMVAVFFEKVAPWTGRFYSLLDPAYAKNNIPIIASVSEHQPTAWGSYYFDLHYLCMLFPAGLYHCFRNISDHNIFVILYALTSIYFSGVMVRLMLVLAPVMCIIGGIALNAALSPAMKALHETEKPAVGKKAQEKAQQNPFKEYISLLIGGGIMLFSISYVTHCTWVAAEAYSSPSIVLGSRKGFMLDDYREAYSWLRENTPEDSKIMSWWDYGYQLSAMANRTVIVDNNTWNNTHISRVGQAMASNESHAIEIMRQLDVDYVLVVFGGMVGYSSDDINKFLWMVRIGGSTPEGQHIAETDYYSKDGAYSVGKDASHTMTDSVMYKLSYYRFGNVVTEPRQEPGYDRVRNEVIGKKDITLDTMEEAYTSEHWIVRIYRKGDRILGRTSKTVDAVALYLSCLQLGAVYVPLNPANTLEETEHYIKDSEPTLFVTSQLDGDRKFMNDSISVVDEKQLKTQASAKQACTDIESVDHDDIASLCYTSGTTGKPKGAMLTHRSLASNAETLVDIWKFSENDRLLHMLPFYHVHGLFLSLSCSLFSHSSVNWRSKFDAIDCMKQLKNSTVMSGVPTFYSRLLQDSSFNRASVPSHLRLFISGSAPLSLATWEEFEKRTGHRILERYGMTEGLVICSNLYEKEGRIPGSVGKPIPGTKLRLNSEGGIEIQSPSLFRGYWRNPAKTKEDMTDDEFFITGDVGDIDEKGFVRILGRSKDLVISGGMNIYPKEIEDVTDKLDGVAESAFIGVPHKDFGEALVGVVALENGVTKDPKAMIAELKEHLAGYKIPKQIIFVPTLPRNAMAKVQKKELREQFKNLFL
ncbi:unnamed protein product, partial [Mesorhabditis spiculigera]